MLIRDNNYIITQIFTACYADLTVQYLYFGSRTYRKKRGFTSKPQKALLTFGKKHFVPSCLSDDDDETYLSYDLRNWTLIRMRLMISCSGLLSMSSFKSLRVKTQIKYNKDMPIHRKNLS